MTAQRPSGLFGYGAVSVVDVAAVAAAAAAARAAAAVVNADWR